MSILELGQWCSLFFALYVCVFWSCGRDPRPRWLLMLLAATAATGWVWSETWWHTLFVMGWMVVFIHLGAFYRPSTGEHSLPPLGDGPMTKRRAQRILIGGPMLVLGHFLLAHLSLSIDESWPMLGLSLRLGSFLPGVLALYEIADGVAWYFGWREELELYALLKNKRTQ